MSNKKANTEKDLFTDVDGWKIRYRDTGGSGPVIVFNNGIGL